MARMMPGKPVVRIKYSLDVSGMRFHVLGLGPIGSLIAHNLRRAVPREPAIVLIHKDEEQALRAFRRGNSITVACDGVVTSSRNFACEVFEGPSPASPPGLPKPQTAAGDTQDSDGLTIHSLFVTAKAQHTLPAIQRLAPRLVPSSTIVLLQNGMGMYEELVSQVFPNPSLRPHFIFATNNHGAYRTMDHVVHSGLGSIEFGIIPSYYGRDFEASSSTASSARASQFSINDITKPGEPDYERYQHLRSTVAALLLLEDLNVSWKPISYLQLAMRRKLVVNSVINPLTALMRCRNGDIFKAPAAADIAAGVCKEASNVFAAQIQSETKEVSGDTDYPRLPPLLMANHLQAEVRRVAKLTAYNKSSMLSDIERGRETEVDYINGYIMRLGLLYDIPTPTTATLYHLVKMRCALPLDQMFG